EGRLRLTRRFRLEVTTAPAGGAPATEAAATDAPLARIRRTDLTEATAARALAALHLGYTARPNARPGRGGAFPEASGQYPAPFNREFAYVIVTADSLVSAFQS